jgi:hypothetical protein
MDEFHGDPLERICNDLFAKVLSLQVSLGVYQSPESGNLLLNPTFCGKIIA